MNPIDPTGTEVGRAFGRRVLIRQAMIGLVAWFLDGFQIDGFGSALWGAVLVSLTGWIGNAFIGERGRYEVVVMSRD